MKEVFSIAERDAYIASHGSGVIACAAASVLSGGIPGSWIVYEQGDVIPQSLVRSVAQRQADAWENIKAKRDSVKEGGVYIARIGNWFHSDTDSRIQHIGLKDEARDIVDAGGSSTEQLVIDGDPVMWKSIENGFIPMTAQLAYEIVAAIKVLDKRAHSVAVMHQIGMMASANPEAYDFSAGWPETYL